MHELAAGDQVQGVIVSAGRTELDVRPQDGAVRTLSTDGQTRWILHGSAAGRDGFPIGSTVRVTYIVKHGQHAGHPGGGRRPLTLPVQPPVSPMLSKLVRELPPAGAVIYEPKWDGFRTIVFRDGDAVELGSRNEKPMTRYFPELVEPLKASLPPRSVVDGEVVIVGPRGLDFDALLNRIHPAASRVRKLAEETPASFVAFDLLALGDEDLRTRPFEERTAPAGAGARRGPAARSTSPLPPATAPWPRSGSAASRVRGWTG